MKLRDIFQMLKDPRYQHIRYAVLRGLVSVEDVVNLDAKSLQEKAAGKTLVEGVHISRDVGEAVARIAAQSTPPVAEQRGEICNLLSKVVYEATPESRKAGFRIILKLCHQARWGWDALGSGLQDFSKEMYEDILFDVPALPQILREELYPELAKRGLLSAESVERPMGRCSRLLSAAWPLSVLVGVMRARRWPLSAAAAERRLLAVLGGGGAAALGGGAHADQDMLEARRVWAEKRREDEQLWLAAESGRVELLESLLASPTDGSLPMEVNSKSPHGRTALHIAAFVGKPDCVAVLLHARAEIDALTYEGLSGLHIASQRGDTEVVRLLLAANGDINGETKDRNLPIHLAAAGGHVDVVDLLRDMGGVEQLLVRNDLGHNPSDVLAAFTKRESAAAEKGGDEQLSVRNSLGQRPSDVLASFTRRARPAKRPLPRPLTGRPPTGRPSKKQAKT